MKFRPDRIYQPTIVRDPRRWIRLTAAVVILALMIALSYGLFYRQLQYLLDRETKTYLNESAQRNAVALKNKIDGDLGKLKSLAAVIGQLDTFDVDFWIEHLSDDPLYAEFHRLGFILPNLVGYSKDVYGLDLSDREYAKRSLQGETYISDVLIDKTEGYPTIYYATPIKRDQKVIGAVAFGIKNEQYGAALDMSSFGGLANSFVVDPKGYLIFRSPQTSWLTQTNNLFTSVLWPTKISEQIRTAMIQGETGFVPLSEGHSAYQLMYMPLGVKDWYLMTVVPETAFLKKSQSIQRMTLILTGMLTLILVSFVVYLEFLRSRNSRKIYDMAFVDPLTGYANQNGFRMRAGELMSQIRYRYCVVLLDVDKFKLVNDLFGYEQGDQLLKYMAEALKTLTAPNETFGRMTGDRFLLLLENRNQADLEQRLDGFYQMILKYRFPSGAQYNLNIRAGLYLLTPATSIEKAIDRAALALSQVKGSATRWYHLYNDDIRNQLIEETELEQELQKAIEDQQFQVYLQAKYEFVSGKIIGAEALVRWMHPQKGLISPAKFIPVLERNGLITQVDFFVLRTVCQTLKDWAAKGCEGLVISVNQSKLHLHNANYIAELLNVVRQYQVKPQQIELELTESIFINDIDILTQAAQQLRHHGFRISIDDFGSGYSSLNMLKDIEIDAIKLDRVFLTEVTGLDRGRKIIGTIIQMAHDLQVEIVAEGVETAKQAEFLREAGCDQAQGYYYHRPIPIDEFETLI